MARYTIAALVPDPWASDIQQLRLEHDKWSRQWLPAHVTIVSPFHARMSFELLGAIEQAPVDVRLQFKGWGTFVHDRTTTIWLESGDTSTRDARPRLASAVPGLTQIMTDPAIDWSGASSHHVTVINHVPNEAAPDVEKAVRMIDIDGDVIVPHLTVFQWDSRLGRWLKARPN